MTWNLRNAIITLLIFGIELLIAIYVKDSFIRPFFGDFLAVVLVYFFVRTFLKSRRIKIAICVYLFAVFLEYLQYIQVLELLSLSDYKVLRIVLGSTFDWLDILAYTLGIFGAFIADRILNKKETDSN